MTNKIIGNRQLSGTAAAIPSKSFAHRALICAALADRPSIISFHSSSMDIDHTINSLRSLGSDIRPREDVGVCVNPLSLSAGIPVLDVGESGSTFRFLLPVATSIYDRVSFTGRGRLPERPIEELIRVLEHGGVNFDSKHLPFTTSGRFRGGKYSMPGDVSSQYISGLLFASPLLSTPLEIELTTDLESSPYVDMTIEVMRQYGAEVIRTDSGYLVSDQHYSSSDYSVEGDWSNAAFFLVAGAIGDGISVSGLNPTSIQGDIKILEVLRKLGACVEIEDDLINVKSRELNPFDVDLTAIPDSLPILSIAAAAANHGVSRFYNGKRLRLKESDRLHAVANMINSLGGIAEEGEDELNVTGTGGLRGGTMSSYGDHRLVMAAAIAATISKQPVTIFGSEAVTKSYPAFFDDFIKLGGEVIE